MIESCRPLPRHFSSKMWRFAKCTQHVAKAQLGDHKANCRLGLLPLRWNSRTGPFGCGPLGCSHPLRGEKPRWNCGVMNVPGEFGKELHVHLHTFKTPPSSSSDSKTKNHDKTPSLTLHQKGWTKGFTVRIELVTKKWSTIRSSKTEAIPWNRWKEQLI